MTIPAHRALGLAAVLVAFGCTGTETGNGVPVILVKDTSLEVVAGELTYHGYGILLGVADASLRISAYGTSAPLPSGEVPLDTSRFVDAGVVLALASRTLVEEGVSLTYERDTASSGSSPHEVRRLEGGPHETLSLDSVALTLNASGALTGTMVSRAIEPALTLEVAGLARVVCPEGASQGLSLSLDDGTDHELSCAGTFDPDEPCSNPEVPGLACP
jgi:hypothetical protein